MLNRIICIGNRFHPEDCCGPQVYDLLLERTLPAHTEVIDGGLGGINLLTCLEHVDRVLFVDAVAGFAAGDDIVVIKDPVNALQIDDTFGHNAGLGYLLRVAPMIVETRMPEILLIGINGTPDNRLCNQAADTCLSILQSAFQ